MSKEQYVHCLFVRHTLWNEEELVAITLNEENIPKLAAREYIHSHIIEVSIDKESDSRYVGEENIRQLYEQEKYQEIWDIFISDEFEQTTHFCIRHDVMIIE